MKSGSFVPVARECVTHLCEFAREYGQGQDWHDRAIQLDHQCIYGCDLPTDDGFRCERNDCKEAGLDLLHVLCAEIVSNAVRRTPYLLYPAVHADLTWIR